MSTKKTNIRSRSHATSLNSSGSAKDSDDIIQLKRAASIPYREDDVPSISSYQAA